MPDVAGEYPSDAPNPWQRGEVARALRPEAVRQLQAPLSRFAAGRGEDTPDFEADAVSVVGLPACHAWISAVARPEGTPSMADAEAAVISAYMATVATSHGALLVRYWRCVTRYLLPILRFSLRTIKLSMPRGEFEASILEPMSWFFLDSLMRLESDPNRLCGGRTGPALATRAYGWSPTADPLGASLSLLIMRQTRHRYWPHAFATSPLGHYLRSCGLAREVPIRRRVCTGCGKGYAERTVGRTCPECRRPVVTKVERRLLSTRYIELKLAERLSGADATLRSESTDSPEALILVERSDAEQGLRGLEREEAHEKVRQIAVARARDAWLEAMTGAQRNPVRMAVLLTLARLKDIPAETVLSEPEGEWLKTIVRRLVAGGIRQETFATTARGLLKPLGVRLGTAEPVLTAGYAGVILTRLKQRILR
jgi:hypothetical protein